MSSLLGRGLMTPNSIHRSSSAAALPIPLTNLALWLKADALSLNNNDAVTTWTDSSTNGRNATQTGDATLKPTYKTNQINSKPALYFDGGDYLTHSVIASDPTALTIFVVAQRPDSGIAAVLWGHRSESTRLIQVTHNGSADARLQLRSSGNSLKAAVVTPAPTTTAWHVLSAQFNKAGKLHQTWFNGGSVGQDTTDFGAETFTATRETIGAVDTSGSPTYANFLTGYIAELIIYSAALNNTDANTVGAYLGTKYGITWTNIT